MVSVFFTEKFPKCGMNTILIRGKRKYLYRVVRSYTGILGISVPKRHRFQLRQMAEEVKNWSSSWTAQSLSPMPQGTSHVSPSPIIAPIDCQEVRLL